MKKGGARILGLVVVVLVGLTAWLSWPEFWPGSPRFVVRRAGGVIQELTTPENYGRVAVTFPDTVADDELLGMADALERMRPAWVQLQGRQISGRAILTLKPLSDLRGLTMAVSKVGDEDLLQLSAFPELNTLNLDGSPIGDPALEHLKKLTTLKYLSLRATLVTKRGLDQFHVARPDVEVFSNFDPDDD